MNCPICDKHGRQDNIIRHIATHKKDVPTLMCADNVSKCIESKMPLLYVPKKVIYCLICRKYATTPIGIKGMIDTYTHTHRECCGKFDTVRKHYVVVDKSSPSNTLIMDLPTPPPVAAPAPAPAADADADVAALKKRIENLEADLEDAEAMMRDESQDAAREYRRKNKAIDLLDKMKNVFATLSDEQYRQHRDLLCEVQRVIDEDWGDDE